MDKQMTNKTLLEILVDEMPGLGGWLEGACNIAQDKSGIAWFYRERPRFVGTVWAGDSDKDIELPLATDHATAVITREQYEAELSRRAENKAQAWNGEGLPPVGTVCEYKAKHDIWIAGEIKYIGIDHVVFEAHRENNDSTEMITWVSSKFRPIRTPEKIEAERRERVTKQMFDAWNQSPSICYSGSFYSVYDAIRAGKIEGVKIDG